MVFILKYELNSEIKLHNKTLNRYWFLQLRILETMSLRTRCYNFYISFKAETGGCSAEATSNVRYNLSGNVIMTISRRERHTINSNKVSGDPAVLTVPTFQAPPPSYSEVTREKYMSVPQTQLPGHINYAMISDVNPLPSTTSSLEPPPSYEYIQSASQY